MTTENENNAPTGERIAKRLARAGVCSRREAEAMIAAGRVAVDGRKLTTPATLVTDQSIITVDGAVVSAPERTRVWRYHKPRGLLTTTRDPQGRPTIFGDLPKNLPRVITVGRLDFNSEGLLLLTNDGGLSRRLELPETGWLRRYRVRAFGRLTPADLGKLARGITVEGVRYGPIEVQVDREQGDNTWLTMGLREGKNREIRKVLESFGLKVSRLIRVAYGPFQLGRLEPGEVEEVPGKVLTEQLGLAKTTVQGARSSQSPRPKTAAPTTSQETASKNVSRKPLPQKAHSKTPLSNAPKNGPKRGSKASPGKPAGQKSAGRQTLRLGNKNADRRR